MCSNISRKFGDSFTTTTRRGGPRPARVSGLGAAIAGAGGAQPMRIFKGFSYMLPVMSTKVCG